MNKLLNCKKNMKLTILYYVYCIQVVYFLHIIKIIYVYILFQQNLSGKPNGKSSYKQCILAEGQSCRPRTTTKCQRERVEMRRRYIDYPTGLRHLNWFLGLGLLYKHMVWMPSCALGDKRKRLHAINMNIDLLSLETWIIYHMIKTYPTHICLSTF